MNKRRDTKGRVLRAGESQRSDGRYMYRYVDADGNRRTAYSWKLTETDNVPSGRKCEAALRTLEKRISQDSGDGIRTEVACKTTVNTLFDTFMEFRIDLRENTRVDYTFLYDTHIREVFGKRTIDSLIYSDVSRLYMSLSRDSGLSVSTIRKINAILSQVFTIAVKDNLIRRNPADGVMVEVSKRLDEEPEKKRALTVDQQAEFLNYVYNDRHYRIYGPLFTTLLGTGMRIGEALGLCERDIDFAKGFISVTRSLGYKKGEHSGSRYSLRPPKTKAGIREIPMLSDVRVALKESIEKADRSGLEPFSIDGYSGFIFLNGKGKPYTPGFIHGVLQNIVSDYNRVEMAKAKEEDRDPHYLPKIAPHILRHTFCTRLGETEHDVVVIRDVMGHKTSRTTLDVYSDATEEAKKHSFENIEGLIRLR